MGGLRRTIKRAVSGVTKTISHAGSQMINVTKDAVQDVGKVGTGIIKASVSPITSAMGNDKVVTQASDPSVQQAPDVQAPTKDEATTDESGSTSSDIKKGRATGKKSLTVARASGGGVNV